MSSHAVRLPFGITLLFLATAASAVTLQGGGLVLEMTGSGSTGGQLTSIQVDGRVVSNPGAKSGFWVKNAPANGTSAWVPLSGTVDSSGNVTVSGASVQVQAHFTLGPDAIRLDGTVRDTSGQSTVSRGVVLRFALPVGSSAPVEVGLDPELSFTSDGGVLDLTQTLRWNLVAKANLYPLITAKVTGASAVALVVPPETSAMYRTGHSQVDGLYVDFDLGLSSASANGPEAAFAAVMYRSDSEWSFRDALAHYYALFPSSFTSSAPQVGSWLYDLDPSSFDGGIGPETFDYTFDEHAEYRWQYDSQHDIRGMTYSLPWEFYESWANSDGGQCGHNDAVCGRFRTCDGGPCPCDAGSLCACPETPPHFCGLSQDEASQMRQVDLAALPDSGRPELAAVINNAGMRTSDGGFQYDTTYFGYQGYWVLTYHLDPDPRLPSPNSYDWQQAHDYHAWLGKLDAQDAGQLIAGWYLDNVNGYYSGRELDFNTAHFPQPGVSLTYDYQSGQPGLLGSVAEQFFIGPFRDQLHSAGRILFGNGAAYAAAGGAYLLPRWFDAIGIEGDIEQEDLGPGQCPPQIPSESCPDFDLRMRRALMFRKAISTLDYEFISPQTPVTGGYVPDAGIQSVEYHLRHLLVYVIEPGFNPVDRSNLAGTSQRLQLLAPVYQKYVPWYRTLAAAGWEPVPFAKVVSGDNRIPGVFVERYGGPDAGDFYLTVRNSTGSAVTATLDVELDRLGIQGPVQVSEVLDSRGLRETLTPDSPQLALAIPSHETLLLSLSPFALDAGASENPPMAYLNARARCGCAATDSLSTFLLAFVFVFAGALAGFSKPK